jgi:hypothetical protein
VGWMREATRAVRARERERSDKGLKEAKGEGRGREGGGTRSDRWVLSCLGGLPVVHRLLLRLPPQPFPFGGYRREGAAADRMANG